MLPPDKTSNPEIVILTAATDRTVMYKFAKVTITSDNKLQEAILLKKRKIKIDRLTHMRRRKFKGLIRREPTIYKGPVVKATRCILWGKEKTKICRMIHLSHGVH